MEAADAFVIEAKEVALFAADRQGRRQVTEYTTFVNAFQDLKSDRPYRSSLLLTFCTTFRNPRSTRKFCDFPSTSLFGLPKRLCQFLDVGSATPGKVAKPRDFLRFAKLRVRVCTCTIVS